MEHVIKVLQGDAASQVNRSGWLTLPPHRLKQFLSFSTLNIAEIDLFKVLSPNLSILIFSHSPRMIFYLAPNQIGISTMG
jgi:hypothetical protein